MVDSVENVYEGLSIRCAADIQIKRSPETQNEADVSAIQDALADRGHGNGKDLAYFAILYSARRTFPYGMWTLLDGTQVLFNREYQPILQKKDGVRSYCSANQWIDNALFTKIEYYYDDLTSPLRYLTKHLGRDHVNAREAKDCKKSLLVCLQVLKEFTPKESPSVNSSFSVKDL